MVDNIPHTQNSSDNTSHLDTNIKLINALSVCAGTDDLDSDIEQPRPSTSQQPMPSTSQPQTKATSTNELVMQYLQGLLLLSTIKLVS